METVPFEQAVDVLVKGALAFVTGLLLFLGYKSKGQAVTKDIEVAGALVDNAAIFKLASAIEQHNALVQKTHDCIIALTAAFNAHAHEVRELRDEIRSSVTDILRRGR